MHRKKTFQGYPVTERTVLSLKPEPSDYRSDALPTELPVRYSHPFPLLNEIRD